MPTLRALLDDGKVHVLDGAMGTMLYQKGVFVNVCFDELAVRQPTLIADTEAGMRINHEEVFGPVASIIRVKDYEQALEIANGVEFGLSAGIVTSSLKHARDFQRRAKAGMTMVNLPTAGVDYHVPFGGSKSSSYGAREQGFAAVEFFTQTKTSYSAG